jgi:hypothetical protein
MKVSSCAFAGALCFGAVSAFGLQPAGSAVKAVHSNSPFKGPGKAMVRPINVDGTPLNYNMVRCRQQFYTKFGE